MVNNKNALVAENMAEIARLAEAVKKTVEEWAYDGGEHVSNLREILKRAAALSKNASDILDDQAAYEEKVRNMWAHECLLDILEKPKWVKANEEARIARKAANEAKKNAEYCKKIVDKPYKG